MKIRIKALITVFIVLCCFINFWGCKNKNETCSHDYSLWNTIKEANCLENGTKMRTCSLCNEVEYEEIVSIGHDIIDHEGRDATCTESGYKPYVTCSRCDYTTYEEIDAVGHDIIEHEGVDATCTESGHKAYVTCSRCDYSTYEIIDSLEHDLVEHEGLDATCLASGYKPYVTCSRCDYSTYEEVKAQGHNIIEHEGVDATCTESGHKAYVTCSRCDYSTYEELEATGHDIIEHEGKDATCYEVGYKPYVTCNKCSYTTYKSISKTSHEKGNIEIKVAATNDTLGTKQIKCKHCDYIYSEFNYVDNAYHKNGKLSVVGTDLVNQYGEKYQLYGLSTHGLQWFSKVVNFDTICEIQENFGNNVIRFALYTDENGYCDGSEATKKKMLETLEKGIDIATQLGLYVIVDWHMVGAENILDKNPLTYLEEAKTFFSYMAEKYKNQNNIIYEIMNEPNGDTTWADCKKYANIIIPLIREHTDAIVLVGNPKWTADLNSVMKDPLVGYTNIMYTYHFYAADHSSTTQVVNAYAAGIPVFISEFGFMESSGDGSISETNGDKWKKVLDTRNISYVAWNISNSKGSASIFKYNTSNLSDVSDANLKTWGIYLKNWYRAKSLNQGKDQNEELVPTVELETYIPEWNSSYECFIVSSGDSESRLDYEWSSTNELVATISEYSTISIHSNGTCSIICKNKTTGEVGILDIIIENGNIVSYSSRYTD